MQTAKNSMMEHGAMVECNVEVERWFWRKLALVVHG